MNTTTWERFFALGGAVFGILFLISLFIVPQPPTPQDSTATITAYFTKNHSGLEVQLFLQYIAVIGVLLFIAALTSRLWRTETESRLLSLLALVSALVAFGAFMVVGACFGALAYQPAKLAANGGVVALYTLSNVTFFLDLGVVAVWIAATAVAILRTGMLPRWLGWLSVVASILTFTGTFGLFSSSKAIFTYALLMFIVMLIWPAVTGITMFLRKASSIVDPAKASSRIAE